MIYTTATTITVQKVLPKGVVTTYVDNTDDAKISVEVKNTSTVPASNATTVFNPTTAQVVVVNSTLTADGSITISAVPVTDGINSMVIKYYNNVDADVATIVQELGRGSAYKVTSTSTLVC